MSNTMRVVTRTIAILASACLLSVTSAKASIIINASELAGNVVLVGSGDLNLTDLTQVLPDVFGNLGIIINPSGAEFLIDVPTVITSIDVYSGVFTTPSSYGTGALLFGSSGTGDAFGFHDNRLTVPEGYAGGPISGTATFSGSFVSTGLTPGSYIWSWGSGSNADSITLNIPTLTTSNVPEPTSLLVWSMLGIVGLKRRRHKA